MRSYSPTLDRALALAATAHRLQLRKGSGVPYIAHPAHVAILLIKHGFAEAAVVAAVLHDVVEDTEVTHAQVRQQFGDKVAELVEDVSERKYVGGVKLPWVERKKDLIARLEQAGPLAAAVKSADALHNCQSLLADLQARGVAVWRSFRGSPDEQLWYFQTLTAVLRRRLGGHPILSELDEAVGQLERWHRENPPQGPGQGSDPAVGGAAL